jgi:nucleoside phosphorylase
VAADRRTRVAVLGAMRLEVRPLVRACSLSRTEVDGSVLYEGTVGAVDVVATTMRMGTAAAADATGRILATGPVDHLVVIGVAGGVGPTVTVRDLVVPEAVIDGATGNEYVPAPLGDLEPRGKLHTSDEFLVDPQRIDALVARGVIALDMETASIAAVCEARGVPWSCVRALSDHATDAPVDPIVMQLSTPEGGANVGALVRYLLPAPWRVRNLSRLARNTNAAAHRSVAAAVRAFPML